MYNTTSRIACNAMNHSDVIKTPLPTSPLLSSIGSNVSIVYFLALWPVLLIWYYGGSRKKSFWNVHPSASLNSSTISQWRAGFDAIRHTRELVERCYEKVRYHSKIATCKRC